MDIQVRLFGAFRDYAQVPVLPFQCEPGIRVKELRQKMRQHLLDSLPNSNAEALLEQSVFANERAVLNEDHVLESSQELAIIPPVCGG